MTNLVPILPSKSAMESLWDVSYACKDVWNILNEERQRNNTGYYALKKMLPELKRGCSRLKGPCSQTLQEVVKSLCAAWGMFLTKRRQGDKDARPPRFKSYKYFFAQKYPQQGVSFEIVGNTLRLAYGKNKKDWIEIQLPALKCQTCTVKNVVVSYDKVSKNWYAGLTHKIAEPDIVAVSKELAAEAPLLSPESFCPLPIAYNPFTRMPVHFLYFDPGCRTALTGIKTDGTLYEYDINPLRELNLKHYRLIDNLKSARDKKERGCRQWRRLNAKMRNIYVRMACQSKHYLHAIANRILRDHPDVIALYVGNWSKPDTLAGTGMTFIDKRINRQVQNNNPVMRLIEYLSYKAEMQCKKVEKFDERGTTRTCSCCGYVFEEGLSPTVRTFKCPRCGFSMPRDINSTLNFLYFYRYAVWRGLRALASLSIARFLINPSSGKNRRTALRSIVLNYQDARGL